MILLVTALYGPLDTLQKISTGQKFCHPETNHQEGYKCIVFTDQDIFGKKGWIRGRLTAAEKQARRQVIQQKRKTTSAAVVRARFIKTHLLELEMLRKENPVFIVWMDGSIRLTGPGFIQSLLQNIGTLHHAAFYRHSFLPTAAAEVSHSTDTTDKYLRRRYRRQPLRKELEYFYQQGFSDETSRTVGHISSGIFILRNTEESASFCRRWWEHISLFSIHDQLSLGFLIWKMSFRMCFLLGTVTSSPDHMYIAHK